MCFRTFVTMHKKGGTKLGTLYEKITALCKSKGVSGSRMCLDLGLSKSTMSDLKFGRIKGISIPTAQKIAGYFGITVDELYGDEGEKENYPSEQQLTEVERLALELFRKIPEDKQAEALDLLRVALKMQQKP